MTAGDKDLIKSFEDCTIPLDQWNQRTHVSIAYLYLTENEFGDALDMMRRGVKAYNAHNGIVESPVSGYNETTTVAFLRIIDTLIKAYDGTFPTRSADEFCEIHPQVLSKHVLRFFYSPERRMHPDAKTRFIEPDLAPLPEWGKPGS